MSSANQLSKLIVNLLQHFEYGAGTLSVFVQIETVKVFFHVFLGELLRLCNCTLSPSGFDR